MEIAFYTAAIVAVAATMRVITCANAVHALLYLITSLLAVAVVFYALGAPFAAALEVIVYAGAIMVLFVFVVMMLNFNAETTQRERSWLAPRLWAGPGVLGLVLLGVVAVALGGVESGAHIDGTPLNAREIGMQMFGPYVLVVELAAFVLLAALVVAAHLGREERPPDHVKTAREGRNARKS
ncbi:NADH:ubiquinone oxidoreductase subunit J [Salinisphaera orenii MK-B5]|uniref:NADH-quinone oxidoreductase subunit J n=2 Tax=Salinisphaera orenii TaxID=856731 RepID=A0A423PH46_9GAMM|nr:MULTISPECIES: NADH-quinone oxidoreductase subunit J [Salinisphaera]ROO24917.1 NADH:ubiquinone oxidoreductase subunit J [Salinisphaera orenii MK-B5]ROO37777.1 NADH:ubiquinone oxidoreductase subunit J [Salinisphaera halophila YIM 95161]